MNELSTLAAAILPMDIGENGIVFDDPKLMRSKIDEFERLATSVPGEQMQIKTTHTFSNGLYAREIFIPKGTIVIGRIHRHECISIMSRGDKTTMTEDGVRRLKAPFSTISRPGLKRVGYAHEDTVWTTIHATNERDLKKLEEELFTENYSDVDFKDLDITTFVTMEGKLCRE